MTQKRHILIQISSKNWSLVWELHSFVLMGHSAVEADLQDVMREEKKKLWTGTTGFSLFFYSDTR